MQDKPITYTPYSPTTEHAFQTVCSECGAVVADQGTHTHWHNGLTNKITTTLQIIARMRNGAKSESISPPDKEQ